MSGLAWEDRDANDLLDVALYKAVRDGYVVAEPCPCNKPDCAGQRVHLTPRGLARAEVLRQAAGVEWGQGEEDDPTVEALEFILRGTNEAT
jgi:hypothetical protein